MSDSNSRPSRLLLSAALFGAGLALTPLTACAGEPTRTEVYAHREGSPDRFTSLDIYELEHAEGETPEPAPIVVFVHGGGWSLGNKTESVELKDEWCARNGWVLVSVNYRLSPAVQHPEHARDVAAAVAWVREHANEFGGDPDRIALIGHSAGAHLAAIVGCDESLLEEVGMEPKQLAGVIPLDGAAFNLPERMPQLRERSILGRMYRTAFGDDPELWRKASPVLRATPEDELAPLFCVHAGARVDSRVEGRQLVESWTSSGARAQLYHAPDKNHAQINRMLGAVGDEDTLAIEAFLKSVFEKPADEAIAPDDAAPDAEPAPEPDSTLDSEKGSEEEPGA